MVILHTVCVHFSVMLHSESFVYTAGTTVITCTWPVREEMSCSALLVLNPHITEEPAVHVGRSSSGPLNCLSDIPRWTMQLWPPVSKEGPTHLNEGTADPPWIALNVGAPYVWSLASSYIARKEPCMATWRDREKHCRHYWSTVASWTQWKAVSYVCHT